MLGAGLALATQQQALADAASPCGCIFQPAEEVIPGGAHEVIEGGWLDGVDEVFALHCDPGLDVGEVGLLVGPITAAADSVEVTLRGHGGHTSRPHLTQDLTYALAKVVTDVPAALSRRLDPRAGAALVWGSVHAGGAPNVIPSTGTASGTLRMLDAGLWQEVGPLRAGARRRRGGPVRRHGGAALHPGRAAGGQRRRVGRRAARRGPAAGVARTTTVQSLGGEDFAWYLAEVPGAMGRLGTRTPGGPTYDLHQGDLVIDERAIGCGAKVLVGAVLDAGGVSPARLDVPTR